MERRRKYVLVVDRTLDSSLKKNTAFIKRLRTAISPTTLGPCLQDIRSLSLHKYLSEVITACYEGLCRLKSPGEVNAGVEVVSALHQRFGPAAFTAYLGWLLGKGLATPERSLLKSLSAEAREKEERERLPRQRVLLRVVTELWLVGVLRTLDDVRRPDDVSATPDTTTTKSTDAKAKGSGLGKGGGAEPFLLEVLKDLLGHDREHANLPLLVSFIKASGWDLLGVKEAEGDGRKHIGEDGLATEAPAESSVEDDFTADEGAAPTDATAETPMILPEMQERLHNIIRRYFEDVKQHLVRDGKALSLQARRDTEAYVKSGQLFEDRQANYDRAAKALERLSANAQVIADAIGAQMPDHHCVDEGNAVGGTGISLIKTEEYLRGDTDGAGIWEDEEERRFYENLVDLKGKVPGMLLEDGKKKKVDEQATLATKQANDKKALAEEEQSTAVVNRTTGAQVDVLLTLLPQMNHKDTVDDTAVEFCFLNSKASRNRLVKALQEVPRGRGDLLPMYARLIATLGRYMPDITKMVIDHLDQEFRSLQRRKEKDFLGQARLGNIRYLAELTKFGVVPEHIIFHCFKVSLDDFSRMNIEIMCNLLENCGRYLLRHSETAPRMTSFLETLKRKKSVQHIGQQERMLIENAIYYVDPPPQAAIEQKERTPVELFVRQIVYSDMDTRSYTKVLKQIRKLHWEEREVVAILEKIFSKPGKVKYGNIYLLAILVSALHRYHQDFVVSVIDNLLESITIGLELNDFKLSQRRIAEVKYLGELYNYRMVDHPIIFDTMYRIMTFGHGGPPVPGRENPLDLPDDFFRIRLVATLLETCGIFFNRGAAGKKLDFFLSFLQYYIYTKEPLPMDMEFVVQDVFTLTRPQWKLATSLEEATKTFQLAIIQDRKATAEEKPSEAGVPDSEGSSDDIAGVHGDGVEDIESDVEDRSDPDEPSEVEEDNLESREATDSDDEQIIVTRQEAPIDLEEEAAFEREYAKMMADSLDSRKFERKPAFDVPLPVRRKERDGISTSDTWSDDAELNNLPSQETMKFSLLTKRGNRQQTRTVAMPSDSSFAIALKSQQAAEREEQQRIKDLVLRYDDMREGDEMNGATTQTYSNTNPNIHKSSSGTGRSSNHVRGDKSGTNRSSQRARKLQLSDVDWYASPSNIAQPAVACNESQGPQFGMSSAAQR